MRYSEILEDTRNPRPNVFDATSKKLDYHDERTLAHKIGCQVDPSWASKLTERELQAIEWYRSFGHLIVNKHLSGIPYSFDPREVEEEHRFHMTPEEAISLIDSALAKASLKKTMIVYRGFRSEKEASKINRMTEGQTFVDPRFVSASLSEQYAFYAYSRRGKWKNGAPIDIVMRTIVPAGSHAAYLSYEDGVDNEVLLGRNRSFKYISRDTKQVKGTKHQLHTLTFELIS